ncbi:hypothetical protein LENED_003710 [Lentinula edodes]|uniref:Uncharacterized protein n=1 Tax=Lentinula edodes TaxID=5353 RepID=A0A1Q3E4C0_LENED|nr:hypothetical protein LENED_003710 [Lentinula edodes]
MTATVPYHSSNFTRLLSDALRNTFLPLPSHLVRSVSFASKALLAPLQMSAIPRSFPSPLVLVFPAVTVVAVW